MELLPNSEGNNISHLSQNNKEDKLFEGNSLSAFVYKKTERITTAFYLLTALLKDEEPLKWSFRKMSADLLGDIVLSFTSKESASFERIQGKVASLSSLVQIAEKASLISSMNAGILDRELHSLREILESRKSSGGILLDSVFFDVGSVPPPPAPFRDHQKDNVLYKGHSMSFINSPLKPKMEKPPESLKDRKTEIMSIVKREREVSIKDITPVIKGVGEKTIQRELTALVKAGVLKKVGERRWSKYMLA